MISKGEIKVKRVYEKPKAIPVDFRYDVQVKATSGGISVYGDPQNIGRCQQSSATSCVYFWTAGGSLCKADPFSIG